MKVALYARVSKGDESQDPENQLMRLREYAKGQGLEIFREYSDKASGADANRPELDQMMADARAHRLSLVLVVKVDRLARSVSNLYSLLSELDRYGVKFHCTDQDISTESATGKLLLSVLAGIAEFERELISDRTKAGLARAKANGSQLGRPAMALDMTRVHELRAQGAGYRKIAKEVGVSHQTVRNRLRKEGVKAPNDSTSIPVA